MAAAPYILARNLKEAHGFAREELGLKHGRYRVVNTPSTLKSLRNVDLHLVPGWQNRFDRFAMKGALRWTRMNVIDHSLDEAPAFVVTAVPDDTEPPETHTTLVARLMPDVKDAVPDDLEPAGEQLTTTPITADEAHALVTGNGNTMISEGGPVADEPEVKRRRRRCNDCGTLHFKEEPCAQTETLPGV